MDIQNNICPRCGGPSPDGGICSRCRVEKTQWISCDPRVTITWCPGCGATKTGSVWSDTGQSREELAYQYTLSAIHLHPDVKEAGIDIRIDEISSNRSRADAIVRGTLYGVPVDATCRMEIVWAGEQCDRCCRISGSYYEGIIQVRAAGRRPGQAELADAARIAGEMEEKLQENGERLSFISHMEETRDGLDITVGSIHIGQEISQAIIRALGGRFTTHPKLVGEKEGKRLYRITFSLRLPRYARGDVVEINGRYGEVLYMEGRSVRYLDLTTGADRTVREDRISRLIGNAADAKEAMVCFSDGDIIGVMETGSCITRECQGGICAAASPGDSIRVLQDGDTLIPVR